MLVKIWHVYIRVPAQAADSIIHVVDDGHQYTGTRRYGSIERFLLARCSTFFVSLIGRQEFSFAP